MDELLEMLLERIMNATVGVERITSVKELQQAVWDDKMLVRIFAFANNDKNGWNTHQILNIADKAYQQVLERTLVPVVVAPPVEVACNPNDPF